MKLTKEGKETKNSQQRGSSLDNQRDNPKHRETEPTAAITRLEKKEQVREATVKGKALRHATKEGRTFVLHAIESGRVDGKGVRLTPLRKREEAKGHKKGQGQSPCPPNVELSPPG